MSTTPGKTLVDAAQHVVVAERLVQLLDLDEHLALLFAHRALAALASMRRTSTDSGRVMIR